MKILLMLGALIEASTGLILVTFPAFFGGLLAACCSGLAQTASRMNWAESPELACSLWEWPVFY